MKVTMRPATKLPKIIIHREVAAYCRVSTQQEIQQHSVGARLCCAYSGREAKASDPFRFIYKNRSDFTA